MNEPKRYRKKPVIIEAIQYEAPTKPNSGNIAAIQEFGAKVEPEGHWDPPTHGDLLVWNSSHDDWNLMHPGDWVIKGTQGEFYPCEPVIFDEAYEEVRTVSETEIMRGDDDGTS